MQVAQRHCDGPETEHVWLRASAFDDSGGSIVRYCQSPRMNRRLVFSDKSEGLPYVYVAVGRLHRLLSGLAGS